MPVRGLQREQDEVTAEAIALIGWAVGMAGVLLVPWCTPPLDKPKCAELPRAVARRRTP